MDNYESSQARDRTVGIVNLVSGGLDSTLVGLMAYEEGIQVHPLFIDYGQRAAQKEWQACLLVHQKLSLPSPVRMDLSGYGKIIRSGLTCADMDIRGKAFTPGRNLMFLLMGSAYAYQVGVPAVAIGLLSEKYSIFPDQKGAFLAIAEEAIGAAIGKRIKVINPLSNFSKADVIKLANEKGISNTYSCHSGTDQPCEKCISCLEFELKGGL